MGLHPNGSIVAMEFPRAPSLAYYYSLYMLIVEVILWKDVFEADDTIVY